MRASFRPVDGPVMVLLVYERCSPGLRRINLP